MTEDPKVTRLPPRLGLVPSDEDTLTSMGLVPDNWPRRAEKAAWQVADKELRELRQRFLAMARAAGTREQCHRQMAEADMLERVELETLAARIGEILDNDDPEPRGAA